MLPLEIFLEREVISRLLVRELERGKPVSFVGIGGRRERKA